MTDLRILLVEFFFPDRYSQFRSRNYPYLLGQAHALGAWAKWLCCWTPAGRSSRERYIIELEQAGGQEFIDTLVGYRATHLLISEKLAGPFEESILNALPELEIINLVKVPSDTIIAWPQQLLPQLLGLSSQVSQDKPEMLMDAMKPEYSCQAVNREAHSGQPSVHICAGVDCTFGKKLSKNRFFENLKISAPARPFGCSFCVGSHSLRYPFETRPVDLAISQLEAATCTRDTCLATDRYVISCSAVFHRLEAFLNRVLSLDLPPCTFFLSCRIDDLLKQQDVLETMLPKLEQAGHGINIFNMGVENFSQDENDRLNKGLAIELIEMVDPLLKSLEARFPDNFQFTSWGGYGLILFTPWTTLDDLRCNLDYYRRYKLLETEDFALTSKLQILSESAICQLAEADGLLTEDDDFHYYDSGCMYRHDQIEQTWRFKHQQIGQIYRIACRILPISRFGDQDTLHPAVQRLLDRFERSGLGALELFEATLAAFDKDKESASAEEILAQVNETYVFAEQNAAPEEDKGPPDEDRHAPDEPEDRQAAPVIARATEILMAIKSQGEGLLGFESKRIWSKSSEDGLMELVFEFVRKGEKTTLHLLPYSAVKPSFLCTSHLLLRYNESTPVDTVDKERLAWIVAANMEHNGLMEAPSGGEKKSDPPVPVPDSLISELVEQSDGN